MSAPSTPRRLDLAWLGGIVDGEGCITVQRYLSKSKGVRLNPAHIGGFMCRPYLTVVNANRHMIEEVQRIAGAGTIHTAKREPRAGWSRVYRYQVSTQEAREVIRLVRPYLRCKRDVADLVLALPLLGATYGDAYEAKHAEMMRLSEEIRRWNTRGVNGHDAMRAEHVNRRCSAVVVPLDGADVEAEDA